MTAAAPASAATSSDSPSRLGTVLTTGLMLFALFFGAGNLIFPPALGASSGSSFLPVLVGFCLTGVLMPLVAVIAVSRSGEGIVGLARRVGPRFGVLMPAAVYLSIGPLYAVPRVVIVSYELATRPVLEMAGIASNRWLLSIHALIFLGACLALGLRPSRLAARIGRWLTPALLALLLLLTVLTLLSHTALSRPVQPAYAERPLVGGLVQGYLTMDVLAATVFGIVVIHSLRAQGVRSPRALTRATIGAGSGAACLLAAVYVGLAMMGARTPGDDVTDGTALLRSASFAALGRVGVVVLAGIVVLACMTTAVGLLSSFSTYAASALTVLDMRRWLSAATLVSFALANLGLTAVLAIIAPLTLILYPIAITLVVVTLIDAAIPGQLRASYRWPVWCAVLAGAVSAAASVGMAGPSEVLARMGWWNDATGWILPTFCVLLVGLVWDGVSARRRSAALAGG